MRISASSYLNTAPLIWSFLYGSRKGVAEVILDNAPSRSAALLGENRVDAALVPVVAFQSIDDLFVVPGVCVGAREGARSVCLVTRGAGLSEVETVALDTSSKTSVALTKIIFREFLQNEPRWIDHEPDLDAMLRAADCALLIGDPALTLAEGERCRKFDLAEIWNDHTGLGFVFAMWMTRQRSPEIDFAGARDEGLGHLDEIIANYHADINLSEQQLLSYLSETISFAVDESMEKGLDLFFELSAKHGLIESNRAIAYCADG